MVTAAQMRNAEQRAILEGTPGIALMQRAAASVFEEIARRYRTRRMLVLCGPGNNGGDGFMVAELARRAGWPVEVVSMLPPSALHGDAKTAAEYYQGPVLPFSVESIRPELLVVDALFGTGLERPVEGMTRQILATADALECEIVAVDVPSGVHSDSGAVMGGAAHAALTVALGARKPAHALFPGREYAGEVVVADIGITSQLAQEAGRAAADVPLMHLNVPALWQFSLRWPGTYSHKYARGGVLVAGGPLESTGAARLAATAAARVGAGAVMVACDAAALPVYASHFSSVMTRCVADAEAFHAVIAEDKWRALLIGPGHGIHEKTALYTLAALATGKPCVLDADALSVFAGSRKALLDACHGAVVMTPHEGECRRLFGDIEGDKITRAVSIARLSKAVVVLKGADTVVASAQGQVAINMVAAPDLATAGSGDVLAGMIAGLLATGMPAFEAAAAAVWMHGVAGERLGAGLLAEDLPGALPEILRYLRQL